MMIPKEFELKDYHLHLLREGSTCVHYAETYHWGHIGFGGKRPFGNSDMVSDMAEYLGIEKLEGDYEEYLWPKGTGEKMEKIYQEELPCALSIVLQHGPNCGKYVLEGYDGVWTKL